MRSVNTKDATKFSRSTSNEISQPRNTRSNSLDTRRNSLDPRAMRSVNTKYATKLSQYATKLSRSTSSEFSQHEIHGVISLVSIHFSLRLKVITVAPFPLTVKYCECGQFSSPFSSRYSPTLTAMRLARFTGPTSQPSTLTSSTLTSQLSTLNPHLSTPNSQLSTLNVRL